MSIRAILYDLDGTLWHVATPPDFDQITRLQANEIRPILEGLGLVPLDVEALLREFWVRMGRLARLHEAELIESRWDVGPEVLQETLADFNRLISPDDAVRVWFALHREKAKQFALKPFDDTVATLTVLDRSGVSQAIVTNHPLPAQLLLTQLQDAGFPDAFATVITSVDVGYRKPHPLIFETALATLGMSPVEVAVIGDSIEVDLEPAAALGMLPVLILNGLQVDSPPYLVIESLASLLDLPEFRQTLLPDIP